MENMLVYLLWSGDTNRARGGRHLAGPFVFSGGGNSRHRGRRAGAAGRHRRRGVAAELGKEASAARTPQSPDSAGRLNHPLLEEVVSLPWRPIDYAPDVPSTPHDLMV